MVKGEAMGKAMVEHCSNQAISLAPSMHTRPDEARVLPDTALAIDSTDA